MILHLTFELFFAWVATCDVRILQCWIVSYKVVLLCYSA